MGKTGKCGGIWCKKGCVMRCTMGSEADLQWGCSTGRGTTAPVAPPP